MRSRPTIPVPMVSISRLSYEMAQWEIHALRTLLTIIILRVQYYSRRHPAALELSETLVLLKQRLNDAQLEALLDPKHREERTQPTEQDRVE